MAAKGVKRVSKAHRSDVVPVVGSVSGASGPDTGLAGRVSARKAELVGEPWLGPVGMFNGTGCGAA